MLSLQSRFRSGAPMHLSCFSLPLTWHSNHFLIQEKQLCKREKLWLMSKDSLTQKLKAQGFFHVELLYQGWTEDVENGIWQRDVLLCVNHKPWIFARTALPETLLLQLPFDISKLGTKPLGEQLFNHPQIKQTHLSFTCIPKVMQPKIISTENYNNETPLIWGRARRFTYQKQDFSVFEFFLDNAQKALRG
tara:strand:+ start:3162 stop:3734 length:573 start_codon:yes stop_codon:yes gene_type:complete